MPVTPPLRRPGPSPLRLGKDKRQPAPITALPPGPATSLLHVCPDEHPLRPQLAVVLRPEATRGETPCPGRPCPCSPSRQCPVGLDPRPPDLRGVPPANRPDLTPGGSTRRPRAALRHRLIVQCPLAAVDRQTAGHDRDL